MRSAAPEDRCALLAPRPERLGMVLGLGAAGAHRFQRAAVEPAAGGLVDCPLQPGKRQRRVRGKGCRQHVDSCLQLRRRDRLVEIADAQELRRLERLRGHEHLLCRGDAEPADIALDAAGVIDDAETRRRHDQPHALDPDPEIAGQRQIGRAPIDTAVQRRDCWHPQPFERIDRALEGVAARLLAMRVSGAPVEQCADMVAGAESLCTGAGQHQDADRRVLVDPREGLAQQGQIVRLDAIVLARPVEPDRGATLGYRDDRRRRTIGIAVGCGHLLSVLDFGAAATLAFGEGRPQPGTGNDSSRWVEMIRASGIALLLLLPVSAIAQTAASNGGAVGSAALRNGYPTAGGAVALPNQPASSSVSGGLATGNAATTSGGANGGTITGANGVAGSAAVGTGSAGGGAGRTGAASAGGGAAASSGGAGTTSGGRFSSGSRAGSGGGSSWVLCAPSGASGIAPLFAGTDLSCVPD